ncbi:hypothetical protein D9M68_855600 [compost metagenome]
MGNLLVELADGVVHHQVGGIAGMVGDRFGANEVAAFYGQGGRLGGIEVAPVDGLGAGGQVVQHVVSFVFCSRIRSRSPGERLD